MTDAFGPIAFVVTVAAIVVAMVTALWRRVVVQPWESALVYRDGAFVRALPPGAHRVFGSHQRVRIVRLATHPQRSALGPLDVISADRFAFRLHVALTWTIADPRAAWEAQEVAEIGSYAAPAPFERTAAAALAAVGTRALDDVIADPPALATAIRAWLAETATTLAIETVEVTRIDLPPETRRMLTEVERARRGGQAALERARAEQASLRALANAARLVRDNPELAQLRLLRTIEEAKGPTTIVVGDPRAVPPAA